MERFRDRQVTAVDAAGELGISPRRFHQLYHSYLRAVGERKEVEWVPGHSGGNRRSAIPDAVRKLWARLFSAIPPASYSFAASEALRRFEFSVDRATVRRWALSHDMDIRRLPKKAPAPVRRWQCGRIGTLWQLDVSPHPWFGAGHPLLPLFDMLDDCSRLITGARLYGRETLAAYVDFLALSFERYGLPLALYVDYHSFFFSQVPDALTYLGEALHFYDISFRYAPTPQAKGKVERLHLFWQKRLPSLFAVEAITDLSTANPILDELREHRNRREIHRELNRTPQSAWNTARREKRSDIRLRPRCPWWNYIWSIRTEVKVDVHGTVAAGTQRYRLETCSPKTVLTRCAHRDGSFSFLLKPPRKGKRPIVVLQIEAPVR